LWVYIAATAVRMLTHGGPSHAAGIVGAIALAVWAVLEVFRGVNPFRRVLGAVVLLVPLVGMLMR
jgi:hypothetical protein